MEKYIRASNKQIEYIASLCKQVGEFDPTPYEKFSMEKANKFITRLKKKLAKQQAADRQTKLL